MEEISICISQYRKLLNLLAEDAAHMERCVQGEVLEAYLSIVKQEREVMQDALNMAKNYFDYWR